LDASVAMSVAAKASVRAASNEMGRKVFIEIVFVSV